MDHVVAFDIYSRRATRDFVYNAAATSYGPSDNSVRLFSLNLWLSKFLLLEVVMWLDTEIVDKSSVDRKVFRV